MGVKKYQITQIGTFHTHHCEDFTLIAQLGTQKWLCAVMDGCTMGTDSYFAATLFGKILRKIAREFYFKEFIGHSKSLMPIVILKQMLNCLFEELIFIKNQLQLERDELLSTLILAALDFQNDKGSVLVIGDGVVCLNGTIVEFEQDNQPDYLGYHLSEDFETWFSAQQQFLEIPTIRDVSFSTDGILTFEASKNVDVLNYLLINQEGTESENLLQKKLFVLESEFGLKPTDDLGIVRIINN